MRIGIRTKINRSPIQFRQCSLGVVDLFDQGFTSPVQFALDHPGNTEQIEKQKKPCEGPDKSQDLRGYRRVMRESNKAESAHTAANESDNPAQIVAQIKTVHP